MAKVKLPIEMANGVMARTIEDLRGNFDIKKVVGHFLDGKLKNWLEARYYEEELEKVDELSESDPELAKKLCEIFDVEYTEEKIDAEEIATRNERIAKLKQYTDDEDIISNVDSVAFDQEELADLYDKNVEKIYLCEGEFKIPDSKKNIEYFVIGNIFVKGLINKHIEKSIESYNYQYLKDVKKKSIVKFGKYDWIVIEKTSSMILLLSRKILCKKEINKTTDVEWENCYIRKWLNEEFINEFTNQEKNMIIDTVNENKASIEIFHTYDYEKEKCVNNLTNDKIFLLSIDEIFKYFDYSEPYPGVLRIDDNLIDSWMTRTPVKLYPNKGIYLFKCIDSYHTLLHASIIKPNGIRPAMWINV